MTGVDEIKSQDGFEYENAGVDGEEQHEEEKDDSSDLSGYGEHDEGQRPTDDTEPGELGEDASQTGDRVSVVDTDPEKDSDVEMEDAYDYTRDAEVDFNMVAPSEVQGLGGDSEQREDKDVRFPEFEPLKSKSTAGANGEGQKLLEDSQSEQAVDAQEPGGRASGGDESQRPSKMQEAFKALGDALEEWHRRSRGIQKASDSPRESWTNPQRTGLLRQHSSTYLTKAPKPTHKPLVTQWMTRHSRLISKLWRRVLKTWQKGPFPMKRFPMSMMRSRPKWKILSLR